MTIHKKINSKIKDTSCGTSMNKLYSLNPNASRQRLKNLLLKMVRTKILIILYDQIRGELQQLPMEQFTCLMILILTIEIQEKVWYDFYTDS
jgi:hypothetical protein